MPDTAPIGAPVMFSLEGTFMEKPVLRMDGQAVPYESLSVYHYPEVSYEHEGKVEIMPEETGLLFSLSGKIGQLEANVSYRVKANEAGHLVLVRSADITRADNSAGPKNSDETPTKNGMKKKIVKKVNVDDTDENPVNTAKKDPQKKSVPVVSTGLAWGIKGEFGTRLHIKQFITEVAEGLSRD